ncbi:MAG: prepilin-type N-terminal cleavage/methylation domain-containing protein [candidate division Zixibacteria bacterium]|nr:prepilin-type N-terminal cleavage/methylation domain-containing protein [candidate division Zixibacteria bacterium]
MNNQNGLSLLETLISMVILAIGILGLAPMVVLSIDGNNISQDILAVTTLAKEKMELYEGINVMPATPYTQTEYGLSGMYDVTTTIRDNASDSTVPVGIYQVDIYISWTDKGGMPRSTSYSTLVSE